MVKNSALVNSDSRDAIEALWQALLAAFEPYGGLSPAEVARWRGTDKKRPPATLKASTVGDWVSGRARTAPSWPQFRTLLMYLDSFKDHPHEGPCEEDRQCWRDLWIPAWDVRKARRGGVGRSDEGSPAEEARSSSLSDDPNGQSSLTKANRLEEPGETKPPPQPPSAGLRWHRWRKWRPRSRFAVTILIISGLALAALIGVSVVVINRDGAEARPRGTAPPRQSSRWLCSRVNRNTGVYPAPNRTAKQIKWKAVGEIVEVLPGYPHPAGWVVVHTPCRQRANTDPRATSEN